jgi:DnaK suppressor protein
MRTSNANVVRRRLLARRREVLSRYRHLVEIAEEERGTPEIELVDDATRRWDVAVLATLCDADLLALADIEHALLRLELGEYGVCGDCHEAIDPQRLAALPEASRCIGCANRLERAGHHHDIRWGV